MATTPQGQRVGAFISGELTEQGLTQQRMVERLPTGSLSIRSVGRAVKGEENVTPGTYRQIEIALGLPRKFLTYLLDGNPVALRALPRRPDQDGAFRDALILLGDTEPLPVSSGSSDG